LHSAYQIRLLLLFAVTFSLVGLSGPLAGLFQLPFLPTLPSVKADVAGGYGQWYPAGAQMQTLSISTFAGAGALFTGVTTGQVDTGDWPLTASQQASACPSTPILECTQPVPDQGFFGIDFNLAGVFWGIPLQYGNNAAGIQLREGIAHLINKAQFSNTECGGGLTCIPNDNPVPPYTELPAANPCNWDTLFPETNAGNCVVGAPGGTAFNCATVGGVNINNCPIPLTPGLPGSSFAWQPLIGSTDFCAAAQHFTNALGGSENANCELIPPLGGWPAAVTALASTCSGQPPTADVCFFTRNDNQYQMDLGRSLAQEICALFSPAWVAGGWATLAGQPLSCDNTNTGAANGACGGGPCPFLQLVVGGANAFCGLSTSTSGTPSNCWGMYTSYFANVFPFDHNLYFTYNSIFATKTTSGGSTCTGQVLTDAPGNYMYVCDQSYDSLSSLMEFANCPGSPGPSPDPTPGAASPTFATCAGAAVSGTCGASSGCSAISAGYQAEGYFGSHAFSIPIWSGIDKFPVHDCWDLGDSSDPGFQAEFGGSASGLGPTTYMFNILNAYCSQAGSGSGFGPAGVYRAGLMDTPTTASPFKATTIWDFDLIGPVYDTLFKTNPMCSESPPPGSVPTCSSKYQLLDWMTRGHSFVCNAAVGIPCDQAHLGYTPPPNTGATLHVTLNPNMRWHDSGLLVSAWDVKYTFINLDVTGAFQAGSLTNLSGIQVLSQATLDLNLKARGPFTDLFIGGITIMPGHTWSACGSSTWNSQVGGTNLAGTTLVNAPEDNCVGTFDGFLPGTSTQACPSSSISSNGIPVGCIGALNGVSYADSTFDPITNGFLIGSGPWVCESTNAAFAPVGTVGTGCSADDTQSPAPQLGAYTLTRMGCNIATGACVNPAGSAAPPPTGTGPDYFHSSGFLALYIWTGMTGGSSDVLRLAAVNGGSPAVINHYKQGIGNPGGTGNNAVTALVKARINAFKGYNWIAFSTEKPPQTTTSQQTISVASAPAVSFSFSPGGPEATSAVTFTATTTGGVGPFTFSWDFGDGGTSVFNPATHAYTGSGPFTVTVTATDANGATATSTQTVSVGPALGVSFTYSPSSPQVSQSVTFTPTTTGGSGGGPFTFSWVFGDGSTGTGSPVAHTYSFAGSFTVSVTTTDSRGVEARSSLTVTVVAPLTASISHNPSSPYTGHLVSFTGSASGGTAPYTYSWNFGDGSTAMGQSVSHTYSLPGPYTVTLTVTDGGTPPRTVTFTQTVTVSDPPSSPTASFSYSPSSQADVGTPVMFTASATGVQSLHTFDWNFGDGSTGTGSSVTHTYMSAGSFTVTLTLTVDRPPPGLSCTAAYTPPGTTFTPCSTSTAGWTTSVLPGIGTYASILYQWGAGNTFGTVATPDPARTNGVFTQSHSNVYALVSAQWFTGGATGSGCAGPVGTAASAYPLAGYDC